MVCQQLLHHGPGPWDFSVDDRQKLHALAHQTEAELNIGRPPDPVNYHGPYPA